MDFLKEITITFSESKKRNFEKFMARKRPNSARKDIQVFESLYQSYLNPKKSANIFKGKATYHAIRKRITKELINFLILESSTSEIKENNRELMLIVAKHFIDFKKYEQAWEILKKEERNCDENKDFLLNLKIQRLMLSILPYYPLVDFELIKSKTLSLQTQQAQVDEFQLYFVQIKNMFIDKIEKGDVSVSSDLINKAIDQYDNIKKHLNQPEIHLKIIEIIRTQYAVNKNFESLSKIITNYYNQINIEDYKKNFTDVIANIEYIMAYTFLEIRDFKRLKQHLFNLKNVMSIDETVMTTNIGRAVALESFVNIFENSLDEGIALIEDTLNNYENKITLRERLNLSLNLAAYHILQQNLKIANRIINEFNKSESYYQKNMGKEWVLRKQMIKSIILIDLKHIDLAEKVIKGIKTNYKDLFEKRQYKMVKPFILAVEKYIASPHEVKLKLLEEIEQVINLNKNKVFKDPRLIIFYAWLRSKFIKNTDIYSILKEEYQKLNR